MGNPETSDPDDWRGLVDYAWSHAVVSDETHKIIGDTCDFNSDNTWSNPECSQGVDEVLKQYKEIDIYSLYTSVCSASNNPSGSMEVMFKSSSKMVRRLTTENNIYQKLNSINVLKLYYTPMYQKHMSKRVSSSLIDINPFFWFKI